MQDVRNFQRVAVGGTVAMIVLSIVLTVCFTKFVDVDMSTSEAVVTGIALSFSSTAAHYDATVDVYAIRQIWTTPDAVRAAPRTYAFKDE